MILVLCFDDPALVNAANQAAHQSPGVFGVVRSGFANLPQLGVAENLFITAHGAKIGDDNNPVIGDQQADFWVNAVDLLFNIGRIFPRAYRGDVYISACESANNARGSFSFAEVFRAQLQSARLNAGHVYGQLGAAGLGIPLPGSREWVQA